jgi:peptidoglycan/LPS O-acetylase OafA/YrhL
MHRFREDGMTWWMWFAAGVGTVVAALMFAALVSRWFREPATHRAGIGEDEDDPEPQPPKVRIDGSLFATPADAAAYWASNDARARPSGLGPPPTYPETPEEHTR